MNVFWRPLAGVSLVLLVGLQACTLPRVLKQAEAGRRVSATPTPLLAAGESVPFEVTARVPARHLHQKVVYELLLRYRYDHGLREDTVGRLAFLPGEFVYDDSVKNQLVARKAFTLPNTPSRNPGELLARPQSDRTVLVAGRPIDTTPPAYSELDDLMRH